MPGGQYDLSVILRVLDKATAPLQKIGTKFQQLTKPIKEVDEKMQALGRSMQKVGDKMSGVGRSMSMKLTLPLTLMAGLATKTSISFESAWTGVRKTVDATDEELAELRKGLMGLAREIPLSTQEIFKIGEAAGQLGIKVPYIKNFAKVMADLGATTNLAADEAATQLARFANIVQMPQDQFERLGSTIVHLGNNLATTEAEIVHMGMRLAGAGKLVGLTEAQIMGLAAALSSVGIEAESGGTSFSHVMREIDKQIGSGSMVMKGFAYVAGQSVREFETLWKKNAVEGVLKFIEGLDRLHKGGTNINKVLDDLGMEGIRMSDALLRSAGAGDLMRNSIKMGTEAWKENIALTREANLRYETSAAKLTIAANKALQMAETYGKTLKEALLQIIDALEPVINFLKDLDPATKKAIIVIGALVAALWPVMSAIAPIISIIGDMIIGITVLSASGATIGTIGAAFAAILAPIAAATAALGGVTAAVIMLVKNWDFLKKEFADNPFSFIADMLSSLTFGLIPAFEHWIKLGEQIVGAWTKVEDFFIDLFDSISAIIGKIFDGISEKISGMLTILPDWIREKIGVGLEIKPAGMKPLSTAPSESMASTIAGTSSSELQKSETDINIRVSSDPGVTTTIEKVVKKRGDATVKAASVGYVGAFSFGGP